MKTICIVLLVLIFGLAGCQTAEQLPVPARVQVQDLRDDDGDGVANARDICADSPVDSLIDNNGCAQWGVEQRHEDFLFEFDFDKDAIRQSDLVLFPEIVSVIEAHPDASISIVGDTSNEGTDDYNQALGLRRADAVMDTLKQYGIDESRIVEFLYNDESLVEIMQKRKRRTIARLVYHVKRYEPKWNIYTVENKRNEK
jgi:OOP family OmpA-OmpF porin